MKRMIGCFMTILILCTTAASVSSAAEPALAIDTVHVYDGMESSFAKGYLPIVDDGQAQVVLPLLSETVTGPLTVTVNLGDPINSPFVYKNHEKQFNKEIYTLDSEEAERYLIKFSFALAAERINGNYPITFQVSGETVDGDAFSQDFMLYVSISDGSDLNVPKPDSEPEPAPSSQPKLMVESYTLEQDYLPAGESAAIKATIRNTSIAQEVRNIKLSFLEGSGEILPGGTGAEYVKQIAKGGSYTWSFVVTATTTAQSKPHMATITMEYEDSYGNAITASDRIILQARQPVRLEYEEPSLPTRVTQGDTSPFSITLMNLGKSVLYNVLLKFDVPGLSSGSSVLVGTISPGESQTGRANLQVGPEVLGPVAGTLLLSYEDEYGEQYEREIPLATTIEEKLHIAAPADAETAPSESKFSGWIIFPALGALLLALIFFATRWLREKKARDEDEMRL